MRTVLPNGDKNACARPCALAATDGSDKRCATLFVGPDSRGHPSHSPAASHDGAIIAVRDVIKAYRLPCRPGGGPLVRQALRSRNTGQQADQAQLDHSPTGPQARALSSAAILRAYLPTLCTPADIRLNSGAGSTPISITATMLIAAASERGALLAIPWPSPCGSRMNIVTTSRR